MFTRSWRLSSFSNVDRSRKTIGRGAGAAPCCFLYLSSCGKLFLGFVDRTDIFWFAAHFEFALGDASAVIPQIVEYLPDGSAHILHGAMGQSTVVVGCADGVDRVVAQIWAKCGDHIATIGNVNCGLMQTGTDEEVDADIRRYLHEGMDDGRYGFCFAKSNCIYMGFPLKRYERMVELWRQEGGYDLGEIRK